MSISSYSIYLIDSSSGNSLGFVEDAPERADGSALRHYDENLEDCVLHLPKKPPKILPDYIRTMLVNRLFSTTAMGVVSSLRLQPEIQWVNVDVQYKTKSLYCYQAIVCEQVIPVLDLEKSEYKWLVPGELLQKVKKWVLAEEKIPDYDLFKVDPGTFLVSEAFKATWESAGLTGAEFSPCEIS